MNDHTVSQFYAEHICKIIVSDDETKIVLLSYKESPFMGNVEMLMKLYKGICNFENSKLQSELDKIAQNISHKIIGLIKQLCYLLLSYTLKLIAIITDTIKNDTTKKELKEMLLKYSVVCVYNMNNFMKSKIEEKIIDLEKLQSDLVRMGKVKIEMYKKIDELSKSVTTQNNKLNEISQTIDQLNIINMTGGFSKSDSNKITSNRNTSSDTTIKEELHSDSENEILIEKTRNKKSDKNSTDSNSLFNDSDIDHNSNSNSNSDIDSNSNSNSNNDSNSDSNSEFMTKQFNDSDCNFSESDSYIEDINNKNISYLSTSAVI